MILPHSQGHSHGVDWSGHLYQFISLFPVVVPEINANLQLGSVALRSKRLGYNLCFFTK